MPKRAGKLATRYARALLTAVEREQGTSGLPSPAQEAAAQLTKFAAIWQREKALTVSLQNPMFEKGERMDALTEIAKKAGLADILVRFLRVCFDRDRIGQLVEITRAFSEAADRAANLLQVEVTTAREVTPQEQQSIEQSLARQLKGNLSFQCLSFQWRRDAAILGGLIVRYAGKVLDGSLGGRLARVEEKLLQ